MVDAALDDFWRLIGLQVLPQGGNDQSVEVEGVGRILVARRGDSLLLSGFSEPAPGRRPDSALRVLARSDYRYTGTGTRLHPAVSADGHWGFLSVLSGPFLTGAMILSAFESLCDGLQAASGSELHR